MTAGRSFDGHRLVVGLEVHARLRTRTKCFCPCPTEEGHGPNARTCPTCLGLPGGLPVLSRDALTRAVRTAVALDCAIAPRTWWERKHYAYADLPKGYQITQHAAPVGTAGRLTIDTAGGPREVRIRRVHLEEDTGRSVHGPDGTRLDFDRAGTPLVEIVTEPDLSSPEEVAACVTELRHLLRWIGASTADMERGELRCEPNVNVEVRVGGIWRASPIVEVKNLNSISAAARAVAHERDRQLAELAAGGPFGPEPRSTRGWDDTARRTTPQRAKEAAADYRFLPDPDLPVVTVAPLVARDERRALPEPPRARRRRFVEQLGVTPEDAVALTGSRELADWFEQAVAAAGEARSAVAGWLRGDVLRSAAQGPPAFPPAELGTLVREVERGRVPRDAARHVVLPALAAGRRWRDVVAEEGLDAASDEEVVAAIRDVVAARADLIARARAGRTGVVDVLVGEVMARTRGRADGAHVRSLVTGFVTGISDSGTPESLAADDVPPDA